MEHLLNAILRVIMQYTCSERTVLFLEKESKLFVVAESTSLDKPVTLYYPVSLPLDAYMMVAISILHHVRHTHESILIHPATSAGQFTEDDYINRTACHTIFCMPMLQNSRLIGLLYLENTTPEKKIEAHMMTFFHVLVSQMAISLENARLYAEKQHEVSERWRVEHLLNQRIRLASLNSDVSSALACNTSLPPFLQQCTNAMIQRLDAALVRIWLLDEPHATLVLQASAGSTSSPQYGNNRMPIAAMHGIDQIIQERQVYLTNSVHTDLAIGDREWAHSEHIVSYAGYPLVIENKVVGVLMLYARTYLTEFTIEALSSTATTIAIAITNAKCEKALQLCQTELHQLRTQYTGKNTACMPENPITQEI